MTDELAERFANQEQTRVGAIDEIEAALNAEAMGQLLDAWLDSDANPSNHRGIYAPGRPLSAGYVAGEVSA